jgi:hypothetical protein
MKVNILPVSVWSFKAIPFVEISVAVGDRHKAVEKILHDSTCDCYCSHDHWNMNSVKKDWEGRKVPSLKSLFNPSNR